MKCFFCDKIIYTPFHITEINKNKEVSSYSMCKSCGSEYLKDVYEPMKKKEDLNHIKTPEELLQFLEDAQNIIPTLEPCECGLTEKEFDKTGKFGCSKCYNHFNNRMESLVFPWHGSNKHLGKYPKTQIQNKNENHPVEKLKILKLKYAKALEIEEYEKLNDLKKQIDEITQSLPSVSEDQ